MKRNLWNVSLALALALSMLLSGCGASSSMTGSSNQKAESMMSAQMAPSAPAETPMENGFGYYDTVVEEVETEEAVTTTTSEPTADPLAGKNIKLIWTADLNVETLDFDNMITAMNQSIADFGGYVESSYVEGGERLSGRVNNRYGNFTVRIPAAKLDEFLTQMGTIANVTSKSKSSENITLEYADNEARKATLQLEEKKLMELLEQATILEDIITLESRLSEVHYQLDGYSSTLRKYDDLVDFSTVHISVSEVKKMTEVKAETLGERISAGFSDSIYELKVFGEDLIVFLVARSPILLVWAIVIAVIVLIVRALLKRKASKPRKERKLPEPPTYNQPKAPENKAENKNE